MLAHFKLPKNKSIGSSPLKSLTYKIKAKGGPCEQGERADITGCIPATVGPSPVNKKPLAAPEIDDAEEEAAFRRERVEAFKKEGAGGPAKADAEDEETPPGDFPAEGGLEQPTITGLHPKTAQTLQQVHEYAVKKGEEKLQKLALSVNWPVENLRAALSEAFEAAEFTMNIDLERLIPANGAKVTVAEELAKTGKLRNLFEVGTGGGATSKDLRSDWEYRNFKTPDDLPATERPKYAAVNWGQKKKGAASAYGDSVLVLKKQALKDRLTIASNNTSATNRDDIGTMDAPWAALASSALAAQAAEIGVANDDRSLENYTEVQVWGPLEFSPDYIEKVRVKCKNERNSNFIEYCKQKAIQVECL